MLFLPFKQKADATVFLEVFCLTCCFYLSNRRQMQLKHLKHRIIMCCFYLSNRRQMQQWLLTLTKQGVVFTFQTEGRCNYSNARQLMSEVVFTFQTEGRCNGIDTVFHLVRCFYLSNRRQMQHTDILLWSSKCCFYLSNRRQMQLGNFEHMFFSGCFYLSNRRQMQLYIHKALSIKCCFYLSNRRQMQH